MNSVMDMEDTLVIKIDKLHQQSPNFVEIFISITNVLNLQ